MEAEAPGVPKPQGPSQDFQLTNPAQSAPVLPDLQSDEFRVRR